MNPSSEKDAEELLVVAGAIGNDRITAALGCSMGQVHCCASIYEALADVLTAGKRTTTVAIVVDCLEREELEIFSCLAPMQHVRSIAVSALAQSKKLTQGRALGADQVIALGSTDKSSATILPHIASLQEEAHEPKLSREELEKLLG